MTDSLETLDDRLRDLVEDGPSKRIRTHYADRGISRHNNINNAFHCAAWRARDGLWLAKDAVWRAAWERRTMNA